MNEEQHIERESIVGRVVEFLKLHSPFTQMPIEDVVHMADKSSIIYVDDKKEVFKAGDTLHDTIYVIRKGVVRIVSQADELVDACTEGEIFGARAFMSSETYQATAQADPEALLIKLPVEELRGLVAKDAKLMEYFFGDFSSGVALRKRKLSEINEHYRSIKPKQDVRFNFENAHITELRSPITCEATLSIKEAAQIMQSEGVGSIIIVSKEKHPEGIVTDTDLRNKVVTGKHSIEEPIASIMTQPVKTVAFGKSTEEYLMEMIVLGAHHLCITQNGTAQEELLGVITDHDLLLSRGNNAAILIKELRRSKTDEQRLKLVERFDAHVKNLVMHEHPVLDIVRIAQGFNKELLKCTINDAIKSLGLELSSEDFCWLALGSTARGEQIIRTDFDSGIVYKGNEGADKGSLKTLADKVFEKLIQYGYHSDQAGIQANNEEWIQSIDEWKEKFLHWINVPEEKALLNATIFFDLMPFYGNEDLALELQQFIYKSYKGNKRFTAFLAGNALQNPPPLGFFKNLLLEKGGEHKNAFDIKARAMMPLADGARLQSLEFNTMFPSNTIERYKRLMALDDPNKGRYEDCAVAYEIFMSMRAMEGLKYDSDGRFIDPTHLSHLEKQVLKNAFEPIGSIQHLIKPV